MRGRSNQLRSFRAAARQTIPTQQPDIVTYTIERTVRPMTARSNTLRKIKVAYVLSTLWRCGPSIQLANILRYIDYEKFDVSIITLSPERNDDSLVGQVKRLPVKVYPINLSRTLGLFLLMKRFRDVIKLVQPDLIHSSGWRSDSLVSTLNQPANWITTCHNIPDICYPLQYGRYLGTYMARSHVRALRKCDNVVCCSNSMKAEYEQRYAMKDALAIPNGVEMSRDIVSVRTKELVYFKGVTVGRLVPGKNVQYLCEVFKRLDNDIARLTVVGDGPEYSDLAGYEGSEISFVGYQSEDDVYKYLRDSDFFLSASLTEGLPNSVLEALSMGLPCVLSDIEPHLELKDEMPPGSVEIFSLSDSPDAVASRLTDYLATIVNLPRDQIRKRTIEKYSAERMSQRYQALYSSI